MQKYGVLFASIFFLAGCQKYYISIAQENIDINYLASTALGTPDPRQKNPPLGEQLIIEWQVPRDRLSDHLVLQLHVIYKNYTEEFFIYPVPHKLDYVTYSLLGEEYKQKKGILTYQAEIKDDMGAVIVDWRHQLWTKLIALEEDQIEESSEEESVSSNQETNSSVSDQPKQGSVKETEGLGEEESI